MDFLALTTLTAQFLPIMNDSYGGVSGQDSIWRAVLAQMDQSLGGLYLIGLFSIAIPSSSIRAHRIGLLHTPGQAFVDSIEVAIRPKWMNLASQEPRRGQLFMPPSDNALEFAPNLSMFIVPYMLNCHLPPAQFVRLTRADLHQTAARSVARFGIFLASIAVVSTIRMVILSLYMENGVERYLMLGSEIGRWFMAVLQESSILTYSCGYKCVSSWASPVIYTYWDIREEENFRNEVVQSIGYSYHAYLMFRLLEVVWAWMGFLFPWWKRICGPRIFSRFSSPSDDEFRPEEMVILRLRIEEHLELSATWHPKYVVDFEVPSAFEVARREILIGEPWFRWGAVCLCGGFAVCGVVGPTRFFGDGRPANGAKILFAMMQLVAWVLFYKDIPNQSINCEFVSPRLERLSAGGRSPSSNPAVPVPIASGIALSQFTTGSVRRDPSRRTVSVGNRRPLSQPAEMTLSDDEHAGVSGGDDDATGVLRREDGGRVPDGTSDTGATTRTSLASPHSGIRDSPMTTSESERGRVSRRRGSADFIGQNSLKLPLPIRSSTWPQSLAKSVGSGST